MKTKLPTPVVVAIIVVVVAVAGFFLFKGQSGNTSAAAADGLATMNQGKPQTEAVTAEQAQQGAIMMGGSRNKAKR